MVKKTMTHEEHVELSEILSSVTTKLCKALVVTGNKLGKTSKAYRRIRAALDKYDEARCELDRLYHSVTNETQFKMKGNVYYGGKTIRTERNKRTHEPSNT